MSSCPSYWGDANYCSCPTIPDDCVLWGVAYQWLIIAAVVFILACISPFVVDLLIALTGFIARQNGYEEISEIVRRTVRNHSIWLLRWGLIWAGFALLQFPTDVYNVLRYFLAIPFFIILLFWTNSLFNCLSEVFLLLNNKRYARRQLIQSGDKERYVPIGEDEEDEEENLLTDDREKDEEGEHQVINHIIKESTRVVKYIVFIFIVIIGLQTVNVPIIQLFESGTLFTLSIVFSAQPWIRNLIGGLLIFFDNKMRIGEFVTISNITGQVHGISLRTTILKRADKSLVYVPNSRLMEQPLANQSRRKSRLLEVRVHLSSKTDAASIRKLINELEHRLRSLHPSLTSHSANPLYKKEGDFFVVLDQLFELLVWTYVSGPEKDDPQFLEIQSEVMLAITETMERLGIQSASDGEKLNRQDLPMPQENLAERFSNNLDSQAPSFSFTMLNDDYSSNDMDDAMASTALLRT